MEIVLGEAYGWILFEVVLITLHLWFTGMSMGVVRRKFFNKDFYQQKFPQYKSLGKVMKPDGGYPDDGEGRLADLLDDEQWFTLNNYRRAHYNYLEVILLSSLLFIELFRLGSIVGDHSSLGRGSDLSAVGLSGRSVVSGRARDLFSRLSSFGFERSNDWRVDRRC